MDLKRGIDAAVKLVLEAWKLSWVLNDHHGGLLIVLEEHRDPN